MGRYAEIRGRVYTFVRALRATYGGAVLRPQKRYIGPDIPSRTGPLLSYYIIGLQNVYTLKRVYGLLYGPGYFF